MLLPSINSGKATVSIGILKGRLASGRPDDIEELAQDLQGEFKHIARCPRKLRGCIRHSDLPPFLS
jgi:hypothetical protein